MNLYDISAALLAESAIEITETINVLGERRHKTFVNRVDFFAENKDVFIVIDNTIKGVFQKSRYSYRFIGKEPYMCSACGAMALIRYGISIGEDYELFYREKIFCRE